MKPDLFKAPAYYNIDDLLTEEHKLILTAEIDCVNRVVSRSIE